MLVAGGYSALLLGAFSQVIDIWKFEKWAQPFVWIGANSITLYLVNNLIGFRKVAQRIAGGDVRNWLDATFAKGFGEMIVALVAISLAVWLAHFLYRRKIFLRL